MDLNGNPKGTLEKTKHPNGIPKEFLTQAMHLSRNPKQFLEKAAALNGNPSEFLTKKQCSPMDVQKVDALKSKTKHFNGDPKDTL